MTVPLCSLLDLFHLFQGLYRVILNYYKFANYFHIHSRFFAMQLLLHEVILMNWRLVPLPSHKIFNGGFLNFANIIDQSFKFLGLLF